MRFPIANRQGAETADIRPSGQDWLPGEARPDWLIVSGVVPDSRRPGLVGVMTRSINLTRNAEASITAAHPPPNPQTHPECGTTVSSEQSMN
jgi:hypothetical protein